MNILLETGLPEEIDGVPVYADFRNMIRFEQILGDPSLSESEKALAGLDQLFGEVPPWGINKALEKLIWFYQCGREPVQGSGAKSGERAYDFDADAGYIYAAFYAAYGISLTTVTYLHWWEFIALLEGLPEETMMAQIMRYRTIDLSDIKDKNAKAHYAAMKKRFALSARQPASGRSVEEITLRNKDRVAKRFEEAQKSIAPFSS